MRLGEYLEVGTKMKTARKNAGMNQREMAKLLSLTNSAYSNYENGYSEPPAEVIQECRRHSWSVVLLYVRYSFLDKKKPQPLISQGLR